MSKLHHARMASRPPAKRFLPSCAIGVLLIAFVTFLSGSLLAQTGRTTISGRVVDPSGAVVPGAKVAVTNVETNFTVSLVTNEKGYYEASQLVPGQYKIAAEADGFGKLVRQGITLVAGSPVSIELPLAVAKSKGEMVVVTADAAMINSDPATGGQVVNRDTIDNVPVPGANASQIVKLSRGIQTDRPQNYYMAGSFNALSNISSIGTAGQSGKNEFYLDGAPNQSNSHNAAYAPSTDEVSEIKTETSGFDASLGKTLGVSVVTTSKGGTNDFHGSVREMYYNRRWESMTHFTSANYSINTATPCSDPNSSACTVAKAKNGVPGVHEHNSGFTVGGPVILPKIFNGKDKLFFFASVTRDQYTDVKPTSYTVPTMAERQGDFSDLPGCAGGQCGTYTIYDPLSVQLVNGKYVRTKFSNNIIPRDRLFDSTGAYRNPMVAFLNKYLPAPNVYDPKVGYAGTNNYFVLDTVPQMYKAYLLRTDYTPTQKDRIFLRFSQTDYSNRQQNLFDDLDRRLATQQAKIVGAGWTHMLSTSAILDTALGYTQYASGTTYPTEMSFLPSALGLPSYVDDMAKLGGYAQVPTISLDGYSTLIQTSGPPTIQRILSLRSGLSYVKGSHTYTVGAEVRQQMQSKGGSGNTSGAFTFNNTYMKASNTDSTAQKVGLSYAAFLLGIPSSTSFDVPAAYKRNSPYFAWYAQDSWRMTPKLTVTYGLRFEYEYGPKDSLNRQVTYFDPNASLPIAGAAQAAYAANYSAYQGAFAQYGLPAPASSIAVKGGNVYAGVNGASERAFDNNWRMMPRLGVAYQLTPTTVIRGGYGLFFDTTNALNQDIYQDGFSQTTNYNTSDDYGLTWKMGNPYAGTSPSLDPFPGVSTGARLLEAMGSQLGASMFLGKKFTYYPEDYKPARQQRWQLGIEKQLGSRDAISIGYTGSWTDRLEWQRNLNAVPAQYYTGGNVRNPNTDNMSKTVTVNPFDINKTFGDLRTSNPALYALMSSSSTFTGKMSLAQLAKPYPWMGDLMERSNLGVSRFQAVDVQFSHRLSRSVQATVNYQRSFQKDKDWAANDFDTKPTWELSNSSRPSRLTATGRLQLPFGKGERWLHEGIWSKIFGGQTMDFSYEAQQGQLIDLGNIIYTGDPKDLKSLKLSSPVWFADQKSSYVQWLDPTKVVTDKSLQLSSYNLRVFPHRVEGVRQMGVNNFSVNYQRTIPITERIKFVGRFECVDVFNHRIIAGPNTDASNDKFGKVTGDNGNFARFMQIQGKITF